MNNFMHHPEQLQQLYEWIKQQAHELGFLEAKIARMTINPSAIEHYHKWLSEGKHGSMDYLARNQELRASPAKLHSGSLAIISVKLPYLKSDIRTQQERLNDPQLAYVSSYALGRDYHKVVKQLLIKLAERINRQLTASNFEHNYRVFTDSAPIMEVQLASQAGNGWRGKNTLLLNKQHGSMFFLGELFTNLPLIADNPVSTHCGSCSKCLQACPTNAFSAPYVLDATKCISYLTIENQGPIPIELRSAIGNRIYGCDDCQLVCPWNKFSKLSTLNDFETRHNLSQSTLLELFLWTNDEFKHKMQGSAIYRVGYEAWQRNLAVGLGNANYQIEIFTALKARLETSSQLVAEHIRWAIKQQQAKAKPQD